MLRTLIASLTLMLLAACAATTQNAPGGEAEVRYGRISTIENVMLDADKKLGIGAVVGAVAGGLLGNQIGGGTGKTVATVAGAVAGGYAGSAVQSKTEKKAGQQVTVRLDNGATVGITQPADPGLKVGDRVRIDGSGEDARVVRF
ncbi:glycine zipper 2TM domain-containing protein [Ramlibacter sp. XY19]|uniref:glycine zipper 2TM domain-containing protein n=1 Tax=Ramlibacter paludis TaxID=2908000 RepID=UPI0023DB4917|nr:glycine zipper 2TM domain-containing protein [Ramlibacter paludis]MCG2592153.1 glycine zipper 2TM domain-containing protein [Ramlibacter paludis]